MRLLKETATTGAHPVEDVAALAVATVAVVDVVAPDVEEVAVTPSKPACSARSVARRGTQHQGASNVLTTTTTGHHRSKLQQRWRAMEWTRTGTWIPVPRTTSRGSSRSSPLETSISAAIKSTLQVDQVWRFSILVMVFYVPLLEIFILETFCTYHLQIKIFYLFIALLMITMSFLNFIQTITL
jgi:hypothetical protein